MKFKVWYSSVYSVPDSVIPYFGCINKTAKMWNDRIIELGRKFLNIKKKSLKTSIFLYLAN